CAAPFGPASPCGAAPAARVHKQRKVTRRKAKTLAIAFKKREAKATLIRPSGTFSRKREQAKQLRY
ncbi:MAG: hypothetical protein ABN502_12840, partial [Gammaproteobacteria bacterium]